MTLFTVGPVEMFPSTLEVSGRQLPYFRTDEFSALMKEAEALMKKLSNAKEEDRVILLTASGTGAMEAAVMNCLDADDKILVINGGSFGRRFCELCGIHKLNYESLDLGFGEALTTEALSVYEGKGFTAILVNLDETSTGQLYDLGMLSSFCKRNGMYLIVDAISAFLADRIDFASDGIDVLIVSSQKALSLSPGLSLVEISARMIRRIEEIPQRTMYFDFRSHLKDMERGQTPFTPAVGTILELHQRLRDLDAIGIDEVIESTRRRAEYFRGLIKDLPVSIPNYRLSNAVTPIIFDNGGAYEIFRRLKDEYGLVVTPSGGDLRDRMVRVSHIGNLHTEDYDALVKAMKEVIE